MKKFKHYIPIIVLTLTSCASQKHQQQQLTQKETRQLHVTTKSVSIQWDGHLGNWSRDKKVD
ncbi:hypothetical protein SAMN05216436_11419 [bacterium A37T11]|nr:hypothetical protein SAMN05216436_11419 [bacterium A37T11]